MNLAVTKLVTGNVDLKVFPSQVTCVLGAGKSTLIKIISGLHQHTEGEFLVDGSPVRFSTPREALDKGIATVYQDLATVPLMPVWRNFFLGSEITKGPWPVRRLDIEKM
ncbi:ATP-binding cassette domain-containing protein, partial [Streptomyces sp. NPDC088357]|uniref:ATP-binding cassette domain-containing protein n=1 Tax=Streptomyces sp. NPDC088357 TaxID=3154655 RepID=UPI00343E99A4